MIRHAVVAGTFIALLSGSAGRAGADPALTIYNQNFAVVRDTVKLALQRGENRLTFNDITAQLEPDSVILRDPSGKRDLQILEQNYRADPISEGRLLAFFEGKTIDFRMVRDNKEFVVPGKIVRSGYQPHQAAWNTYGQQYYQRQMDYTSGGSGQPIIEVEGKLRFGLPGTPLFPALPDDSILKPTLNALIASDTAGLLDAELAYVTGGMSWKADYNVVAPEQGDVISLVGWVTMDNQSGKDFGKARIKLMAGDVSKIQQQDRNRPIYSRTGAANYISQPAVTEKSFDEYHLYTLPRATELHDRETKQVEFVRAEGVKSSRIYVYNGASMDNRNYGDYGTSYFYERIRNDRGYGTLSNPKVWVMREFKNSKDNRLGMPLPKGRVRFYRRDSAGPNDAGQLEFTGENEIDHTASDETIRIYTGNAFDIVGERKQTAYNVNNDKRTLDESFQIKIRNHKKEPVQVRIVERLYRGLNWEITQQSDPAQKTDSQTAEFRIQVAPDAENTVTYTVHYSW